MSLDGAGRLFRSWGLSLVELMVALAIGAFLMLGVVTVFLANRDSARMENSLARVQESARTAIDLLREDLQRAQYLGCNTPDVLLINMTLDPNDPNAPPTNTLEGVRGYERDGAGDWAAQPEVPDPNEGFAGSVAQASGGARNGSDVLRLRLNRRLNPDDPNDLLLSAEVNSTSTSVAIDDNPGCVIEQGSRVVLTECGLISHLFEVTNAQSCTLASPPNATTLEFGSAANALTSIDGLYSTDAELLLFEEVFWYVRDTGRERNGMPVWALYRQANGGNPEEMVEGIEHMQVEFGQILAGSGNMRFVDPSDGDLNTGLNYEGVQSVRIALLVQGFELVRDSADTSRYVLLGDVANKTVVAPGETAFGQGAVHGGGAVKRTVFTLVVELRNAPTPL